MVVGYSRRLEVIVIALFVVTLMATTVAGIVNYNSILVLFFGDASVVASDHNSVQGSSIGPSTTPSPYPTLTPSPSPTPTPDITKSDIKILKSKILKILGSDKDDYGIYIKDLEYGHTLEINSAAVFPPASIYKVPLAIVTLADVDSGKLSFNDEFLVTDAQKPYSFDRLSQRSGSYNIKIKDLLEYLIIYSDNTAMTTLEHRNGGVYQLQSRLQTELSIAGLTRIPHTTTPSAVGAIFEGLYNNQYLTVESNEYLLNLLKNVYEGHNDKIKAGVPEGIGVAHKIGNLTHTNQDAGIVYGETRDFIIVILNKNITDHGEAADKIRQITNVTYESLQ